MELEDTEILNKEAMTKTLQEDPMFQKSIGILKKYPLIKGFGIVWGVALVMLLITPLPERMLMNQLAFMASVLGAAICLGLDALNNHWRIEEAGKRLAKALEENPKVKVTHLEDGNSKLEHQTFEATCNPQSILRIQQMIQIEEEIQKVTDPDQEKEIGIEFQKGKNEERQTQ